MENKEKMQVLHIGLSSVMGGIESFALNYFRELRKENVVFDFADIYGAGIAAEEEIKALGGKVITFPNFKRRPLSCLQKLTAYIKEHSYDVIHINIQTAANILPVIAAHRAGIIPILHSHTTNATGRLRAILHKINLKNLYSIPAIYLACGEEAGNWMWGNREFKIVPNAIDLHKFSFNPEVRKCIRKDLNIDDKTILVGYVGRLEPVKNPIFLLKIMEEIKKREMNENVKMILVGSGSLEEELKMKIAEAGFEMDICVAGFRKNTNEYLSAMDIFLMPSLHEALSLSAVEAQTNGLLCIFSDTIPKEVKLIDTSVFLDLKRPELWADLIMEALEKPRCGRTDTSAVIAKSPYNIEVSAKKMMDIYEYAAFLNRGRKISYEN